MNRLIDTGLEAPSPATSAQVTLALQAVLPMHCVLSRPEDTRPYECDGLSRSEERRVGKELG